MRWLGRSNWSASTPKSGWPSCGTRCRPSTMCAPRVRSSSRWLEDCCLRQFEGAGDITAWRYRIRLQFRTPCNGRRLGDLGPGHPVVGTASGQQLAVVALLDDLARLHHQDDVSIADRRKTM